MEFAGLSGVPSQTQYSMVSPVSWYDPSNDDIGWSKLTVSSQSAAQAAQQNQNTFSDSWYNAHSSSTSAGGGGSFFGISLGASGGATNSGDANAQGSVSVTTSSAEDQTTNVSISLEWLLCQVQRPWLVSDLFYMDGWYMVNQRKNTISDGTVCGQVENEHQLLPMIPTPSSWYGTCTSRRATGGRPGKAAGCSRGGAKCEPVEFVQLQRFDRVLRHRRQRGAFGRQRVGRSDTANPRSNSTGVGRVTRHRAPEDQRCSDTGLGRFDRTGQRTRRRPDSARREQRHVGNRSA